MRNRLRLLTVMGLGAVIAWFAIEGGEYGTSDLVQQERQRRRLTREIDSLRRVVDSLTRYKHRVINDPATQERIAREEFGMVRGRELLFRMVPADSR